MKYKYLEDMVHGMELTYNDIVNKSDTKYTGSNTLGYTLPPGACEITDLNSMLKFLLPNEVKVNITTDVIRLKSKLTTNIKIKFTKKLFFLYHLRLYTITFRSFR